MFYMHLLISKRGPLAKIWLAAHWERKLTKAHIFECNLETTVEKIISPKFTIALRTSGHLLLGVVRIYHRKAKYLLADCSEALTKMKTAFRPGLLDLPEENFEAVYQSITLPEEFNDFETPLPDINAIDVAEHFTLNQSRAEDITLTEDYESNVLLCDRNFDEEPAALSQQRLFDGDTLTGSNSLVADHNSATVSGDRSALREDTYCFEHDCFGDEENATDMIEILLRDEQNGLNSLAKDLLDMEEECPLSQDLLENSPAIQSNCPDTAIEKVSHLTSEMTLLLKEEEGFVLDPIDETAVTHSKKKKRKRKLLVDVEKALSCSTMYNQLNNCMDTLMTLDLAPPTKKMMMWKQLGGVDTLLSHGTQPVVHAELQTVKINSPGVVVPLCRVWDGVWQLIQRSCRSRAGAKIEINVYRGDMERHCVSDVQQPCFVMEFSAKVEAAEGCYLTKKQIFRMTYFKYLNSGLHASRVTGYSGSLKGKKQKKMPQGSTNQRPRKIRSEMQVSLSSLCQMLLEDEPSYLQESAQSETESKTRNDFFMATSPSRRNETDGSCEETLQDVTNTLAINEWLIEMSLNQHRLQTNHLVQMNTSYTQKGILWRIGGSLKLKKGKIGPNGSQKYGPDGAAFSGSSNDGLDREAERQPAQITNSDSLELGNEGCVHSSIPRLQPARGTAPYLEAVLPELLRKGKDSEEVRWNKRTLQLLKTLQHQRRAGVHSFSFRELCRKNNRKEAAAKFYTFLVLRKQLVIELWQSAPFADITATVGPAFDAH
ncbi:double-strand-break repair protein rad21-like protein 1 [Rhynochetos jubatus]